MQLGTIILAGVCGVVGLIAGRASAPTGPIIIAAAPPPRAAPVIVVAPTPVVEKPDDNEHDDGDGTDVAEALATLNHQAGEHAAVPPPAGQVFGHITDWHDEPAVGCTVVAVSPNLAGEQAVITDEHGDYRITALPPGYYSLTFYYDDNVFTRTDIALREIEATDFDVALALPPPRDFAPQIQDIHGVAPTVALENGFK
jgi:hypothetical protein